MLPIQERSIAAAQIDNGFLYKLAAARAARIMNSEVYGIFLPHEFEKKLAIFCFNDVFRHNFLRGATRRLSTVNENRWLSAHRSTLVHRESHEIKINFTAPSWADANLPTRRT